MQARFLGPVNIQNTLQVDDAALFNDDLTVMGTLAVDAGGDVDIDSNVDIDGTLDSHGAAHFYDTMLVDGILTMGGGADLQANMTADPGVTIDGVDISEHAHKGGIEGKQIPVEGLDLGGLNGTPVRLNAAGYAVYAP